MKQLFWLLVFLLPACSEAEEDNCSSLANTAIGAALGDSTDMYNLGVAFYTGECVEKSYENAAKMWEEAGSSGVISAKNNFGYLLSEGLGTRKDAASAAALWRQAAQVGHAESQVHLGNALFHGYGVAEDQVTGLAWVLRAEESATRDPGIGGGPAVLKLAQAEKAKMLSAAPELLTLATERSIELAASSHER